MKTVVVTKFAFVDPLSEKRKRLFVEFVESLKNQEALGTFELLLFTNQESKENEAFIDSVDYGAVPIRKAHWKFMSKPIVPMNAKENVFKDKEVDIHCRIDSDDWIHPSYLSFIRKQWEEWQSKGHNLLLVSFHPMIKNVFSGEIKMSDIQYSSKAPSMFLSLCQKRAAVSTEEKLFYVYRTQHTKFSEIVGESNVKHIRIPNMCIHNLHDENAKDHMDELKAKFAQSITENSILKPTLRPLLSPNEEEQQLATIKKFHKDNPNNPFWKYLLDKAGKTGRKMRKRFHYFDIYHKHFSKFINHPVRVLEIGIGWGGSLEMWKEYFGKQSTIYGIDEKESKCFSGERIVTLSGNQSDPEFLTKVIEIIGRGNIDVVIDDGSHRSPDQITSLQTLYPAMSPDGVYLVEDLHCSYWPSHGGGLRQKGTFIEYTKDAIDWLNVWAYDKTQAPNNIVSTTTNGIHLYESIAVFERRCPKRGGQRIII